MKETIIKQDHHNKQMAHTHTHTHDPPSLLSDSFYVYVHTPVTQTLRESEFSHQTAVVKMLIANVLSNYQVALHRYDNITQTHWPSLNKSADMSQN